MEIRGRIINYFKRNIVLERGGRVRKNKNLVKREINISFRGGDNIGVMGCREKEIF